MTAVALPALDGRLPLGFLAGLGVTRLLSVHAGRPTRLSWSTTTCTAQLHGDFDSVDEIAGLVNDVIDLIPEGGVLPSVTPAFPPPGAAPDGIRLPRSGLRALSEKLHAAEEVELEAWLSSLVTDLVLDDKGRAAISLYAAPSGKQSMRTMLEKPLELVQASPHLVVEALDLWRRYPGVSGEYLDHQVLFDAANAADGESRERGVPGATWLALMSYPWLSTTQTGSTATSTGWLRDGRMSLMVYPLWSEPVAPNAIRYLLRHPELARCVTGLVTPAIRQLSVFAIGRAKRRQISGRTFAGVLAPL